MEFFGSDNHCARSQIKADAILLHGAAHAQEDMIYARTREILARQASNSDGSSERQILIADMIESSVVDHMGIVATTEYVDAELARLSLSCL